MNEEEIAARLVALRNANASPAVIQQFLASVGRGPVAPAAAPTTPPPPTPAKRERPRGLSRLAGFSEKLLQTINPFQDELTGAVQAVGALVPGGRSPREAYVQERDASRARTAQYAKEDPLGNVAATGLGIVGTLAAGPARAAAKALPLATRGLAGAGRAAAIGAGKAAAYAAPYAFGAAEGTPGEQLRQTAVGTGVAAGLGAVAGPLVNRIAQRRGRGSLAKAIEQEGARPADVLGSRAALDPAVRAATPALANVGAAETALVNRTLRTPKGARLGRQVEDQINTLDVQRRAIGEAKRKLFSTPTPINEPAILKTLTDARQNPAFEKIVRTVQKDMAGAGKVVGEVEKKFTGTIGDALAVGIPEADIIAKAADPKMMGLLLSNPAARTAALNAPVAKVFTYVEKNPYTLEFFDRLQRASRKVLRKDYRAGGTASTELVDTVNDALVQQVRGVHPTYDALQRQYSQYKDVLKTLSQKVRPVFDPAKPMGQRYKVTAHPGAPETLATSMARGAADPLTNAGQVSLRIGLLRKLTRGIPDRAERKATETLLKTGDAGTKALRDAFLGGPSRKVPAGTWRVPGIFGVPQEDYP